VRSSTGRVSSIFVAALIVAGSAAAQERPQPSDEQRQRENVTAPPEEPGWFERRIRSLSKPSGRRTGFFVAFGGIKTGSGVALGPGFRLVSPSGAMLESKAGYSVRNFKLAQVAVTSRPLGPHALTFGARARWQDAPLLPVHALGNVSDRTRGDYAERKTEASINASMDPWRLRLDASAGFERFDTGPSHSRNPPLDAVFPNIPGLYANPDYLHGAAGLAFDTRDGESYARRGSRLGVSLHRYHQQNAGSLSFDRADLEGERYLPFDRLHAVVFLGARASFTSPRPGNGVPFFLMPTLGGGSALRGYSNYRFRDRHALLLTGEYRWLAGRSIDVAVFYDAGKVAATRAGLNLRGLHRDVGVGVRLHGAKTTALRLEVARGTEGLRVVLAFGK